MLKEGVGEDSGQPRADREAAALRLDARRQRGRRTVSLADYVGRMKEGQDAIYYVTADTLRRGEEQPAPRDLPQEAASRCCCCPTASTSGWSAASTEFDGKPLQSVARGRPRPGQARGRGREAKTQEAQEGEHKALLERMQEALGERVKDVRVTHRLTDSPACLVADEHDMGGNLERMLKAAGQKVPQAASRSSRSTRTIRSCSA